MRSQLAPIVEAILELGREVGSLKTQFMKEGERNAAAEKATEILRSELDNSRAVNQTLENRREEAHDAQIEAEQKLTTAYDEQSLLRQEILDLRAALEYREKQEMAIEQRIQQSEKNTLRNLEHKKNELSDSVLEQHNTLHEAGGYKTAGRGY
ncbi:hypothetical protein BDW59DRAFT_159510 [Aspergillus cavernicola]|uniref:Uncharacterized protein n=1 Tax=Aspergillus cavernicola TaxID=176166 RepID=A0ABR4ILR5_9EURO